MLIPALGFTYIYSRDFPNEGPVVFVYIGTEILSRTLIELENANMAAAATQPTFDIPKRYKAVVYDKPGTISTKIEELDTPEPGPGEVLVRL